MAPMKKLALSAVAKELIACLSLSDDRPLVVRGRAHGEILLDLCNGLGWVQALGASPSAVEDGVAPVQTEGVLELGASVISVVVSRVCHPPVALHQDSGSEVLVRVPPVRWATGKGGTEGQSCNQRDFCDSAGSPS